MGSLGPEAVDAAFAVDGRLGDSCAVLLELAVEGVAGNLNPIGEAIFLLREFASLLWVLLFWVWGGVGGACGRGGESGEFPPVGEDFLCSSRGGIEMSAIPLLLRTSL